jgi:hypothetical protein
MPTYQVRVFVCPFCGDRPVRALRVIRSREVVCANCLRTVSVTAESIVDSWGSLFLFLGLFVLVPLFVAVYALWIREWEFAPWLLTLLWVPPLIASIIGKSIGRNVAERVLRDDR